MRRVRIFISSAFLLVLFLLIALPWLESSIQCDKVKVLTFCTVAFLFMSGLIWSIFYRIHAPIRQIMKEIQVGSHYIAMNENDEFYPLVHTLNARSTRIREECNEKETILESLGEGVIAVDAEMNIRYVNFIGSKMIGKSRRQLLGKPFPVDSELLKSCRFLLTSCQERFSVLTDSILLGDAKKIYLDLIAAPKMQHTGAILVLQDKSSHHKVLEMGKDFVANASHELRTPITIIKGFAETLQDLPELPRDMVVDITEKIVRNCQRMDTLVKNLLTLADLENLPDSRFQECDLVALSEACRQVVLAIYQNAHIAIEKSRETLLVSADPDILELAIINLLDNAAKYSKETAKVTIKLEQVLDEAVITISDQGIGISTPDLEHIFERFYTVDKARSRRLGGAGLGLSIVKTIIEKHHGNIKADSVLGEGTTFTIRLPIHCDCIGGIHV